MGRLVLLLAIALASCRAEKFVAPDKPDLYKVPYDFAPATDAPIDLAVETHEDLSEAHDLHVSDDVDLASHDAHEEHD